MAEEIVASFLSSPHATLWLGLAIVGSTVELLTVRAGPANARGVLFNVATASLYLLVIFLVSPALNTIVHFATSKFGAGWIDIDFFAADKVMHQIGAAVVLLFVTDFFYYWLHRAQHAIPWLWAQHVIHHSDETLNVTTAARHHWLEFIFQSLMITLPMGIIFKLSSVSMWTISTIVTAYGWFIHMNIRLGLGPLSRVICGPQVHRIHHSRLPQHQDKNFAAYFPIWDVIFGTYYPPKSGEYPPTGVVGTRFTTPIAATLHPFREWWRMILSVIQLRWRKS